MFEIVECQAGDIEDWIAFRSLLWPDASLHEHRAEVKALVERDAGLATFLARPASRESVGFAEVRLRHDYVNGCDTSPVAFLEGIYVKPEWRRQGVARLLCAAAEDWATTQGCSEFASDALLDNTVSHQMHAALGFEETERVVYFRKLTGKRAG